MEVLKYGFRLSRRSTSTWLEKISDIYLACGAVRTLVSYAYSGENHQTPPETFQKTPLAGWVSLSKVDEACKGENADK